MKKKLALKNAALEACRDLGLEPMQVFIPAYADQHNANQRMNEGIGGMSSPQKQKEKAPPGAKAPAPQSMIDRVRASFRPENVTVWASKPKKGGPSG